MTNQPANTSTFDLLGIRDVRDRGSRFTFAAVATATLLLVGAIIMVGAVRDGSSTTTASPSADATPVTGPGGTIEDAAPGPSGNVTTTPMKVSGPPESTADEGTADAAGTDATQQTATVQPIDEPDEGLPPPDDVIPPHSDEPYGASSPGGMSPTPLDPVHAFNPACEYLLPGLKVAATPVVVLPIGVWAGTITVHNCSTTNVSVYLSSPLVSTQGATDLSPGGQSDLGFEIDPDDFDAGAIAFAIAVTELAIGPSTPVQISAFKPSISDHMPLAADVGLSAGAELTGCGSQCITSAWLSPRNGSADVGLELRSHTAARFDVFLRPAASSGGKVTLSTEPWATSPGDQHLEWTTTLSPLEPDTRYAIEVRATDEDGHVSSRATTFRTADPVDQINGNDPDPACSYQCITKALVSPTGEFDEVGIDIATNAPAEITVFYGSANISWNDLTPSIASASTVVSPDDQTTNWTASLTDLDGNTTYHAIVRAEDVYGRRSYQVGSFHTDHEPARSVEVTFERVIIHFDGDRDKVFGDRGELSFRWGVDDLLWDSQGEHKRSGGTSFSPGGETTILVAFDNENPRILTMTGGERDKRRGPCQALPIGTTWRDPHTDCEERKWNPAPGSFLLDDIEALPFCAEFDMSGDKAVDRCAEFTTPDRGKDNPRFTVHVRFHYL